MYSQFGQDPDQYLVHHFQENLEKRFKYLEQVLGRQKYLAGNEVTLADLFCLPYGERMTQVCSLPCRGGYHLAHAIGRNQGVGRWDVP